MGNDLLNKLEEKINEAIETIELSRMEVSDLKEQNEELENRYADWETRLSTLIEKFEQLEDSEDAEIVEEVDAASQDSEKESEEEVEPADELNLEDAEQIEVEAADELNLEDEEEEDPDNEELGSTFDASTDSFNEASESAQHFA